MEGFDRNIIEEFSQWIVFSGTRSGSPLKARVDVYPLIRLPKYGQVIDGNSPISQKEFMDWHKTNSELITQEKSKREFPIGWATKLINLYLKSMVYLAKIGRPNLVEYIHPPLDNGLWKGIHEKYSKHGKIIKHTHYKTKIKDIETYKDHLEIIKGLEEIARKENIRLIEVEKYWRGTEYR